MLASFPETGIGIVATVPAADGIDIVGSAIAVFAADRTSCEFAITVASEFGGAGLATALMTALIDEARRRGLKEMEGFVLTQNQSMLRPCEAPRVSHRVRARRSDRSHVPADAEPCA